MPMRLRTPMPALEGATEWYRTDDFDPASLENRPTLIHFWAVSCHICHEVMHDVVSYAEKYKEDGLQLIGIHMPKEKTDTDTNKVQQDIETFDMHYPIAVDNQHRLTEAFQNQFVPAFFLFNNEGELYFRAAGDRGFGNLEPKIQEMFQTTS